MIKPETVKKARTKVGARLAATPPSTWAKLGGGLLLGGLAVGWIAFPWVLDKVVASQINLSQGKDSRKLWIKLPPFEFNVYVFNITNPSEVMKGAKPTVQEVGPYCYTEIKDKVDMIEDPATDTISYSARSTWYENQRSPRCKAPQLTGDEILVVPNIPLMAILLLAQRDFPPALLTLVNQALPAIFGPLPDVFSRVSARRLLFDGIPVDCSATALAPRAVCIALKQNSRALKKLGNNKYLFSFFGHKNNTPEEFRYTVKRGTQNGQEIGQLVAVDGKEELPFWRGACNKLQGTDATVFPPFRAMENGSLTAYSSEICRVVVGVYEGQIDYKGVTGYGYSVTFGDSETNSGDRCFCPTDSRCRKDGVLDAFKCQGAPVVSSLPHFYQASQDYVTGVTGLSPDKEKHGILIVLEPISGSPLFVRKRLQFNIDIKPIRFVPLTQRLRRTLLPLFWAEEVLDLDNDLMGMLEASLFRPIRAVDVLKWGSVAAGIGLAVGAAALKARNVRRDKVHAIDGRPAEDASGQEDEPQMVLRNGQVETAEELDPFYVNSQVDHGPSDKKVTVDVASQIHLKSDRMSASSRNDPMLYTRDGRTVQNFTQQNSSSVQSQNAVNVSGGTNLSAVGDLVENVNPPTTSLVAERHYSAATQNNSKLNSPNELVVRPEFQSVNYGDETNRSAVGGKFVERPFQPMALMSGRNSSAPTLYNPKLNAASGFIGTPAFSIDKDIDETNITAVGSEFVENPFQPMALMSEGNSSASLPTNQQLNYKNYEVIERPVFQTIERRGEKYLSANDGEAFRRTSPPLAFVDSGRNYSDSLQTNPQLNSSNDGAIQIPALQTVDSSGKTNSSIGGEILGASNSVSNTLHNIESDTNVDSQYSYPTNHTIQDHSMDQPFEDLDGLNEKSKGLIPHDYFDPSVLKANNENNQDDNLDLNSPPNDFSYPSDLEQSKDLLESNNVPSSSTKPSYQVNNYVDISGSENTYDYNTPLETNYKHIEPTVEDILTDNNSVVNVLSQESEFGEVVDIKYSNDVTSRSTSAGSVHNDKVTPNTSIDDKFRSISDNPTEEEIRLAELDINQLVAEIRQLFPKN